MHSNIVAKKMARKTRIQIAKEDIFKTLDSAYPVLRTDEINSILKQNRIFWRLAERTNLTAFIHFLIEEGKLIQHDFDFPSRPKKGYTWGEVNLLSTLSHIIKDSYFSHYTALMLNDLTKQEPKTIYVTKEQSNTSTLSSPLNQNNIDKVFKKPVRTSNNSILYKDTRIFLLHGANSHLLGIDEYPNPLSKNHTATIKVTSIERTLIDAAIRPNYSGGVFEVAEAYNLAKNRLSVTKLAQLLKRIKYIYPYHQVIGFYLEKAGYSQNLIEIFKRIPKKYDFYLVHNMPNTEYVKEWKLFIPKGF